MLIIEWSQWCYGRTNGRKEGRKEGRTDGSVTISRGDKNRFAKMLKYFRILKKKFITKNQVQSLLFLLPLWIRKQSWVLLRITKMADTLFFASGSGLDEDFLHSIQHFFWLYSILIYHNCILLFTTSLPIRLIWHRRNMKRSRRTVIFLPVYKISSLK